MATPVPSPAAAYVLEPIDWVRASPEFREFYGHYFVNSLGLARREVDLAFLERLDSAERGLAARLLRSNLHLRYTHIIEGFAELRDASAAGELRAMLQDEPDLSRRLTIGRTLWRLERDPSFVALLAEMIRAKSPTLRQAHLDDVLLLEDERSIHLLIDLLDDSDSFVRFLALSHLNGIEYKKSFLVPAQELPHDAGYFRNRRTDPVFIAGMVEHLRSRQLWR
jgi:hypothetical protein